MITSRFYLTNCLLILLAITFGCKPNSNEDTLIMEVNSLKVPCEGVGKQSCLQVKYEDDNDWQSFYSRIEGFDYEQGYIYKLKIIKRARDKENMPMDVSSFTYRLKSILKKTRDSTLLLNDIWGLKSYRNEEGLQVFKDMPLPKGRPLLELNTRKMTFTGHDGCNTFSGSINNIDQNSLMLGNAAATLASCEDALVSDQIRQYLAKTDRYKLEGLELILLQDNIELLRYQKMD